MRLRSADRSRQEGEERKSLSPSIHLNCEKETHMNSRTKPMILLACLVATIGFAIFTNTAAAQSRRSDEQKVAHRGDVRLLPAPLTARLVKLAGRPHTYLPLTVFSEANSPSQFFQYYLLDTTGFQPNVFTTTIPGLNDGVAPTATG